MDFKIFVTTLSGNEAAADFDVLLASFPPTIRERIQAYNSSAEKKIRITGKALLAKALQESGLGAHVLQHLKHENGQQPYIENTTLRYSISHSDSLVVCAIAPSGKIGIDTEKIKHVKLGLMSAYFETADWQKIADDPDPPLAFFQQWTIKEATVKASRLGLEQVDLTEIKVAAATTHLRTAGYYYKMLAVHPGFVTCIVSDSNIDHAEIVVVELAALL
jgi:4'-phosphopantetheinyl transferase